MKKLNIYFYLFLFISSVNTSHIKADVYLENFSLDDVLKNGRSLMSLDYGLHYLETQSNEQKKLFIGVHGSNSEGYEWIYPLKTIDSNKTFTTFFRYNDDFCPNRSYIKLNKEISSLLDNNQNINEVVLIGHSYGAMVVAMFSDKWTRDIPLSIHSVAGPLTGPISSSAKSSFFKNLCDYYPPNAINNNVNFFQWRTIKELDGAFKNLEYDPQVIELQGSEVIRLPETYNNRRLGHNWSLSWVADHINK